MTEPLGSVRRDLERVNIRENNQRPKGNAHIGNEEKFKKTRLKTS